MKRVTLVGLTRKLPLSYIKQSGMSADREWGPVEQVVAVVYTPDEGATPEKKARLVSFIRAARETRRLLMNLGAN